MRIRAWRIVKAKHAATAFSGDGARLVGGRWNSPGASVVYVAGSVSLAILESLVHLRSPDLMKSYVLFEVAFDDALTKAVDPAGLPKNWREYPAPAETQRIGDTWLADAGSAILRVPSVIVPSEWIYLLNPAHGEFAKISIGPKQPVQFDPRLIKTPLS